VASPFSSFTFRVSGRTFGFQKVRALRVATFPRINASISHGGAIFVSVARAIAAELLLSAIQPLSPPQELVTH